MSMYGVRMHVSAELHCLAGYGTHTLLLKAGPSLLHIDVGVT
jgi:hypothetical protein